MACKMVFTRNGDMTRPLSKTNVGVEVAIGLSGFLFSGLGDCLFLLSLQIMICKKG